MRRLRSSLVCRLLPIAAGVVWFSPEPAQAQLTRGFKTVIEATATGEELVAQDDLWVLEVAVKPMRMVWVELTDPKTGAKRKELVWYLVYRAINRPLEQRRDTSDRTPINVLDPPPDQLFIPEFTLVGEYEGAQRILPDAILPEAQAIIAERERKTLKNSVEVVGTVGEVTPIGTDDEDFVYGVVTWRGVDPKIDFCTVFMTGFSSGYKVGKGPDGEPLVLERTIKLDFFRPGDEFDEHEREFRLQGDPEWIYRPAVAKAESTSPAPMSDTGE